MIRVTASKVGLLEHCQYWAREGVEWSTVSSDAAAFGTAFHAFMDDYVRSGVCPSLSSVAVYGTRMRLMLEHAMAWLDTRMDNLSSEAKFAYHPDNDTAYRVYVEGRSYPAVPALYGAADLVWVHGDGSGTVADWKTGSGASAGPQLRMLALMMARAYSLRTVHVFAAEVSEEGVSDAASETLHSEDFDGVALTISACTSLIDSAEPVPGRHCSEMYCPARTSCPATMGLVRQASPSGGVPMKWSTSIDGPDHASWLLSMAKLLESSAADVKRAVSAYVPENGLTMSDGSTLIKSYRQMPRFSKSEALALLYKLGASEEDIAGLTRTVAEPAGLRLKGPPK